MLSELSVVFIKPTNSYQLGKKRCTLLIWSGFKRLSENDLVLSHLSFNALISGYLFFSLKNQQNSVELSSLKRKLDVRDCICILLL